MDAISYSYADKQAKRIKKFINNPDSNSGIVTVPKVIGAGENITIPAGRVAVLPNVQVDGTLNVEGDGEIFIPAGATLSKVVELEGNQTISDVKTFLESPIVPTPTAGNQAVNRDYVNNKYSGFKNYIINGGFDIWQRGNSFSIPNIHTYTADRWIVRRSGGVLGGNVYRNTAAPLGFAYSLSIGRGTGDSSTNYIWTQQLIETSNAVKLRGKSVTLSFYARKGVGYSAVDSKMTVRVTSSETVDAGISASGGNISGETVIASSENILTTSFQKFTSTFSVPENCNTIGIRLSTSAFVGTANDNDFILIAGVQLEEGRVATPFEQRPIGLELSLCERYYRRYTGQSVICNMAYFLTTNAYGVLSFDEMRVVPSVTISNITGGVVVNNGILSPTTNIVIATDVTKKSVRIDCTTAARTAGHAGWFRLNTDEYIELDSEL